MVEPSYVETSAISPRDMEFIDRSRILVRDLPDEAPFSELKPYLVEDDGHSVMEYSEDGEVLAHYHKNLKLEKIKSFDMENRFKIPEGMTILSASYSSDRSYAPTLHAKNGNYSWVIPIVNYKEKTIDFPRDFPKTVTEDIYLDCWVPQGALLLSVETIVAQAVEKISERLKSLEERLIDDINIDGKRYW